MAYGTLTLSERFRIQLFAIIMGSGLSRLFVDSNDEYRVLQGQREIQRKIEIPLQVIVAHYTPSSFPVVPRISPYGTALCRESWKRIVSTDVTDPYGGPTLTGMTAFYTDFYDR